MDIGAVDHVEFYVGDAQQSAFYLCTGFGFRVCGQAPRERTGRPPLAAAAAGRYRDRPHLRADS
ncbi:hypothetical protein ACFQVA_05600 [Actinomadura keratinilytica]